MDNHNPENASVFHKEKEAKRNTEVKSPTDDSLLDISSIVQGNTRVNSITEQLAEHQTRKMSIVNSQQQASVDAARKSKQMLNVEIDQFLYGCVVEGLVDQAYVGWVAKCCHALGLAAVNRLAINARRGKAPQRLFSSLLKGNMNLIAKQQYYGDTDD